MFPYIISLKSQVDAAPNTMLRSQINDERRKNQMLQGQVGRVQNNTDATQQALNTVADTTKRIDPKLMKLNRDLNDAASTLGERVATVKDTLRQNAAQIASVGIKADQALSNSVANASDLTSSKQTLLVRIGRVASDLVNTDQVARANQTEIRRQTSQIDGHLAIHDTTILRMFEAFQNNVLLYAESLSIDIPVGELNAAAAGTCYRDIAVSLVSEQGEGEDLVRYVHPWALYPDIVTTEEAFDGDINPPTAKDPDDPEADPQMFAGVMRARITFDTDEGVTKTYIVGDAATAKTSIAAKAPIVSSVVDLTITFNVVADE